MNLATGIQKAIDYIESHITDELDMAEVASQAACSPYYFQKIFGILCGITVGEYMKRRAIDNYFNRERKNLDEGGASFHWNVQQMREIYNFDDKGMSYMNAGIVYAYDRAGNIVDDVLSTRSGGKVLYKNKIGIDYKFDVYNNNQYLGNVNNIKLKGV